VCALKWDEMYIKSYEEYSSTLDEVEGLVDLGRLGRKQERAKCIFVFCLDSLNARHPWRQPVAYFLPGKCLSADEIIILLKECLDRLNETGADVEVITCDQGTCNQAAYAQLAACCTLLLGQPLYKDKKYFAVFDFPHLVKRLASFLRTHKNFYCDGKIIVSYSDFEITWSIDNSTKGGSNLLFHITEAHIRPNTFEVMNVKRAFQLFSRTFSAAIKTAGNEQELNTSTWQATADFAERINNIIDACNSYSLKITFGGKRPLSANNSDLEILLTNFIDWCSRWSKFAERITTVPYFKGFVITIKSILGIYKALSSQIEIFQLETGLCNQDSVEHLFLKLRQRGGFNPNPTTRMVQLSIRHIL
ncbi:Transposable element P transposase, partial [Harpegnathos saltator]